MADPPHRIPTFVILFIVSILSKQTPQSRPLAAHISVIHFLFVSCFLQHPVHPILKKPSRPAGIPQFALYFLIFDFSSNISPPANVYMYCSHITTLKEPNAAIGGSAMPARHPHRLARKRGMSIPQWPQRQTLAEACIEKSLPPRTPGQPNSFSAHSVPSGSPRSLWPIPICRESLTASMCFRKNKPKSKMEKLPCLRSITHLPSATSPAVSLPLMPWCLAPLAPHTKEQTQSTPLYIDSGVVRSEWASRGISRSNG